MIEKNEIMTERIPLSKKAKRDLWVENFSSDDSILLTFTGVSLFVFLLLALMVAGFGYWIGFGISFFLFFLSLLHCLKMRRRNKKDVLAENFKDWQTSREILSITDYLKNHPLNLKASDSPKLSEVKGLRAVRIDYSSDTDITGDIAGTLKGSGFGLGFGLIAFSFRGEFSGKMKGKSTPELTDQHAVAICVDEEGNSFRLIFPNASSIKKNLSHYFMELAGKYGWGSYVQEALYRLWQENFLDILAGLNHQRIIDYLSTTLESPRNERPRIDIKGAEIKKGMIIVFSINCEGRGIEIVVPFNPVDQIMVLIGEKLKRKLSSPLLLGSGS